MADAYSVGGGGGGDDLPLVSDRGAQCVDDALAAARDVGVDVERFEDLHVSDALLTRVGDLASSFSTPLAPSPLLAESLLLLSRHHAEKDDATSPTSIGLQGIGDAIRALNTLHRECAQEMTRLHVSMQANIKTPNIAQARAALDKSTKRFDKDKHKKRGSLSLRSVSLELHQRSLQCSTLDYATTMQTARIHRDVTAVEAIVALHESFTSCLARMHAVAQRLTPDMAAMRADLARRRARIDSEAAALVTVRTTIHAAEGRLQQVEADMEREERLARKGKAPGRRTSDIAASDVSQAFQDFATNAHQHYAMTPAVGSPSANVVAGGSVYRTITRGGSRVSTRGSGVGLASSGGTLSSTAPPAPPATGGSPRANRTGSLGGRGRGCDGGSASSVVPELPQRGSTTRVGAPSGDSNCSISEPDDDDGAMSIVRAVLGTRPPAVQAAFKEVFAQPANRTCVDCGRALVVTSPTAVYIARDLGVTLCAACAAIHADTSALDGLLYGWHHRHQLHRLGASTELHDAVLVQALGNSVLHTVLPATAPDPAALRAHIVAKYARTRPTRPALDDDGTLADAICRAGMGDAETATVACRWLLEHRVAGGDFGGDDAARAVHAAAAHDMHAAALEFLLRSHADVNRVLHNRTPLQVAASADAAVCAGTLLRHGAQLNATAHAGQPTATTMAAAAGHSTCAAVLTASAMAPPAPAFAVASPAAAHDVVLGGDTDPAIVSATVKMDQTRPLPAPPDTYALPADAVLGGSSTAPAAPDPIAADPPAASDTPSELPTLTTSVAAAQHGRTEPMYAQLDDVVTPTAPRPRVAGGAGPAGAHPAAGGGASPRVLRPAPPPPVSTVRRGGSTRGPPLPPPPTSASAALPPRTRHGGSSPVLPAPDSDVHALPRQRDSTAHATDPDALVRTRRNSTAPARPPRPVTVVNTATPTPTHTPTPMLGSPEAVPQRASLTSSLYMSDSDAREIAATTSPSLPAALTQPISPSTPHRSPAGALPLATSTAVYTNTDSVFPTDAAVWLNDSNHLVVARDDGEEDLLRCSAAEVVYENSRTPQCPPQPRPRGSPVQLPPPPPPPPLSPASAPQPRDTADTPPPVSPPDSPSPPLPPPPALAPHFLPPPPPPIPARRVPCHDPGDGQDKN